MKIYSGRKLVVGGIVVLTFFMIFLQSCQKDLDKVATPDLNPTLALPVVNTTLTLGNILEPDANLIFDTINSDEVGIKVVYSKDSLFSVQAQDFFEMPDNENLVENYAIGGIELDNVNLHAKAILDQLLGSLNQDAADFLEQNNGSQNIFPPLELVDQYNFDLDPFEKFETATFSEGTMMITFTNDLPVPLTDLQLDIRNADADTLIKSFTLDFIEAGETASEPYDLAGRTLPNNINAAIMDFNSPGSDPEEVLINLQDSISMDLVLLDAIAISGRVDLEAQEVASDTTDIAFNPDHGAEIKKLSLSTARIDYSFNSEIPVDIEIELNLPSSELDGSTPMLVREVPAFGSQSGIWNIDGVEMDLTKNPDTAYNRLRVGYKINVKDSEGIIDIDSADFITVDLSLSQTEFEYAEGFFGNPSIDVEMDSLELDIDFFDRVEGGLVLTNPNFNFNYINSIGIPIEVDLLFRGFSSELESRDLNINMPGLERNIIRFDYPQVPGNVIDQTLTINRDNSEVVELLSLPPDKFIYAGTASANTFGSSDNFASYDGEFTLGVDLDLPLEIKTGDLMVQDTLDINVDEEFDDNVESVYLKLHTINRFPFEADIQLELFKSETNEVIDEIFFSGPMAAGESDENSKVTNPGISNMDLTLSNEEFSNMIEADRMIVVVTIATYNNENQSVKLYTDNSVDVFVGIEAQLKTE